MIESKSWCSNINYFIKNPHDKDIRVKKDNITGLPCIMIDNKLVFQMLPANDSSRGCKCNLAVCEEDVDNHTIGCIVDPLVCGEVETIKIVQRRD
jgi:hypothetical protein